MAVRAERTATFDVEDQMRAVVDRIAHGDDHVDIVDGGEPIAVVVSVDAYRRLKRLDEANRQALHELSIQISRAFAEVPDDELERELAKAHDEYRAEKQAEREAVARG